MIPERASSIDWRCATCSAMSEDTALPRDCRERRDCDVASVSVPRDCRERRDFGERRELCAEPMLRGALATPFPSPSAPAAEPAVAKARTSARAAC